MVIRPLLAFSGCKQKTTELETSRGSSGAVCHTAPQYDLLIVVAVIFQSELNASALASRPRSLTLNHLDSWKSIVLLGGVPFLAVQTAMPHLNDMGHVRPPKIP